MPNYIHSLAELPADAARTQGQAGKQVMFLATPADFAVYGGGAGAGKSIGIIMESSRHTDDPAYTGILFRRTHTEIMTPGGLWDEAHVVYSGHGAMLAEHKTTATFPTGAKVKYSHLQYEHNKYDHHGGQYAFIGFDELTTFTRTQVMYLLTRNRPAPFCRVRPYARATCNADADSWVRDVIAWWIDEDTGKAIEERAGVLRYYTIENNDFVWVPKEWRDARGNPPRSFTFIPADLSDNKILMEQDPTYASVLQGQDRVTRERLLESNWNISYAGGMFEQSWFIIEDEAPDDITLWRYWDLAATETKEDRRSDPDWTAGAIGGFDKRGEFWITNVTRLRGTPGTVEEKIKTDAEIDGIGVPIAIEEEKGASGKYTSLHFKKLLKGWEVHGDPVSGQKEERAKPVAAHAERGRVHLVRGPWNRPFLSEVGAFPFSTHKDQVDAMSGLWKMTVTTNRVFYCYLPTVRGHLRRFRLDRKAFAKADPARVEVYVVLAREPDGGIYGNCYVWSRRSRKLRVYSEISHPHPIAEEVAADIKAKAVVSLKPRCDEVSVTHVYATDDFFSRVSGDLKHALRKVNVRVKTNTHYNEAGGALWTNRMFARGQISVNANLRKTDIQYRTWTIENGKPKRFGFAHCRALMLIVCDLKGRKELDDAKPLKPYGKRKQALRNKLREDDGWKDVVRSGVPNPRRKGKEKNQWDYLV